MTRKEKLEARIRNNPRNVPLRDIEALVRSYGHIREGGSHPLAVIENRVFAYRRADPVLTPYVLKVLELIDSLNDRSR